MKSFFWGIPKRRDDKDRRENSEPGRTNEREEQSSQSHPERTGDRCSEQNKEHINTMITINMRGLILKKYQSKVKQLKAIAMEYNAAVIVLTDTWFD